LLIHFNGYFGWSKVVIIVDSDYFIAIISDDLMANIPLFKLLVLATYPQVY